MPGFGGFEAQPLYDSAYDPALARAGYGAFVLTRLAHIVQWDKPTSSRTTSLR